MSHKTIKLKQELMRLSLQEEISEAKSLDDFLSKLKDHWLKIIRSSSCLDIHHWRNPGGHKTIEDVYDTLEQKIGKFNELVHKAFWHDGQSLKELRDMFFDSANGILVSADYLGELTPDTYLYRMRTAERYKKYEHKEIYVIVPSKSNFVSALRYNVSGHPCLYLAESLYLAWEELRRPDFHTTNFACFKANKKLKVLDLTIPDDLMSINSLFRSYVALACCAKTNDEDKHKWQYVIPNMMMQFLHYNHLKCKSTTDLIDGIKYISSRRFECADFQFDNSKDSAAYVFPPIEHTSDGSHCPRLLQKFSMTEAFSAFFYQIHRYDFSGSRTARTSNYQDTLFARLENQLKKEKFQSCDRVIK